MVWNICFQNTSQIVLACKGVSDNVTNEFCVVFATLEGLFTIGANLCWNIKFTKFLSFEYDW